jgi:hypothetical protein
VSDFAIYCLGVGCMTKCETCQRLKNWNTLNEMRDELRKPMQANMTSVNTAVCQITSGKFYLPIEVTQP